MDEDIDIRGEIVVQNVPLDELHVVFEVVWVPKKQVIEGDYIVLRREIVGDVGTDEAGSTRH